MAMALSTIIMRCGIERLAKATGETAREIDQWIGNGIPEKHWAIVRMLTDISTAALHAANERVRGANGDPS